MNPDLLIASSRLSPAASSVVVFLLGGLVFAIVATVAATLLSWHRQRAQLARDSVRTDKPMIAGPTVIAGTVARPGAPFAVRVALTQWGKEWQNKGAWYTTWRETSQTVDSRPFHLVTAKGHRIRVEPGQDVFLVDALDREAHPSQEERVLTAELSPGERVIVSGVMVWAADPNVAPVSYRAPAGKSLVLRPPRAEPMLISSEPLEDRHVRHAKVHKRMLVIAAVAWVAVHGIAFGRYNLLSWFGDVVEAQVERTDTWTTRNKSSTQEHYGAAVTWFDAEGRVHVADDEVSYQAYMHFKRTQGAKVPFRVSEHLGLASIGTRPTIARSTAALALLVNLAVLIAYFAQARAALAWYERKRLVQTVPGRL